jgi:hypothetical protein
MNKDSINLYQIYRPKVKTYPWSAPVVSESDEIALNALIEISKTQPELSNSYLYRVGSMNIQTGKISLLRKSVLVKGKKK